MSDPCPVGLRGIVPSLNTPFTDADEIDEDGLRREVDHVVAAGCVGILAHGGGVGRRQPVRRTRPTVPRRSSSTRRPDGSRSS